MTTPPRKEDRKTRRQQERDAERKKREEIDKLLEEPRLPAFEAPASGTLVEDPTRPKR